MKKLIATLTIITLYIALISILAIGAGWTLAQACIYGVVIAVITIGGVLLSIGLYLLLEWADD